MKSERYKVKSISEIAENFAIISGLNKADEMIEYDLIGATNQEIIEKIQNGFITKERQLYVLAKISIFGGEKRLILSSDTIQSHMHHIDITADDYAKIIDIMSAKLRSYNDKKDKRVMIILAHNSGSNYRLVLKNIPNKDEIFIQSLANIGNNIKRLKKAIVHARNKEK